jgi:hypothetical protein
MISNVARWRTRAIENFDKTNETKNKTGFSWPGCCYIHTITQQGLNC